MLCMSISGVFKLVRNVRNFASPTKYIFQVSGDPYV